MSLPWLFLLITVRALLPLNVSPLASVIITFTLLGLLGWASPARVVRAGVRALRQSDVLTQAKACGCRNSRLLLLWKRALQTNPELKTTALVKFSLRRLWIDPDRWKDNPRSDDPLFAWRPPPGGLFAEPPAGRIFTDVEWQ